eukprot:sb/3465379/
MRSCVVFSLLLGVALSMNAHNVIDKWNEIQEDETHIHGLQSGLETEEQSWVASAGSGSRTNLFDLLQEHVFGPFFEDLEDDGMWEDVLNMTTTPWSWQREVKEIMDYFGSNENICGGKCESGAAPIFGCNCRNIFYSMEAKQCQNFLCNIFKYAGSDEGVTMMMRVRSSKSLRELLGHVFRFLEPYRSDVCECREKLFWGFRKCAEKYDGQLMDKSDLKSFRKGMKSMYLEGLEKVGKNVLAGFCSDDCDGDLTRALLGVIEMLDNSMANTNDTCSHMRHMSDAIYDFIEDMSSYKATSMNDWINYFLVKITDLPEAWWCGRDECVERMNENYNTCCTAQMFKKMPNRKASLSKIMRFINGFMEDDSQIEIEKKTYKEFGNMMFPNKQCKKSYKKPSC